MDADHTEVNIASRNALLCNEKLCSSIESVDNQLDAPFSLANSIARLRGLVIQ